MLDSIKHLLIGPPLPTRQLTKVRALASFSPGALIVRMVLDELTPDDHEALASLSPEREFRGVEKLR